MSAQLSSQPASVFTTRRNALAERLGDAAALVFAGGLRARNYPANVFPYRADSHFLYLVGAGTHPGAGVPGVLSSAKVLEHVVPDARDLMPAHAKSA